MRYDLHLHSYHSDGTLAPDELMGRAHAAGVDVLALTDHDCLDGIAQATAVGQALGMRVIPGVEVSATWEQITIHVIGLNVRTDDSALVNGLSEIIARRVERAQKIAVKLDKRRIPGAYDGVMRLVRGAVIGRAHFARFLVHEGIVPTLGQAFRQYLGHGAVAYVPVQWASLEEAVGWIRGAGGQAVIAHPARYEISNTKLRKLLAAFKECGGSAIEVVGGGQPTHTNVRLAGLANEFGLLGSVGSDYHGPDQVWLEPGRLAPLPDNCVPVWQDWHL